MEYELEQLSDYELFNLERKISWEIRARFFGLKTELEDSDRLLMLKQKIINQNMASNPNIDSIWLKFEE